MAKVTVYNNVAGLNRALRMLPREAAAELRDASEEIAEDVAREAAGKARSVGGVAKLVAPTIRADRDRVPVVRMGGVQKLPDSGNGWTHVRRGVSGQVGSVIWGAEFGGRRRATTHQFMRHLGTIGYFLWPTVRDRSDEIRETYSDHLMAALVSSR